MRTPKRDHFKTNLNVLIHQLKTLTAKHSKNNELATITNITKENYTYTNIFNTSNHIVVNKHTMNPRFNVSDAPHSGRTL